MDENTVDLDDGYDEIFQDDPDAVAKEFGCEVYVAGDDELILDLDSKEAISRLPRRMNSLATHYLYPTIKEEWVSKSGKGKHVVLTLPDGWRYSAAEKLHMQSILGSDFRHAIIAYRRWLNGDRRYNRIFKPLTPVEANYE